MRPSDNLDPVQTYLNLGIRIGNNLPGVADAHELETHWSRGNKQKLTQTGTQQES